MIIALICVAVLLALCIVPLVMTGDFNNFIKRYGIIVAIGVVASLDGVLVYMIAEKAPQRSDLTADQKFTVNPGLRSIMSKLDDQAQVIYYVSSKVQGFVSYKLAMIDKLSEIKNASGGWVDFKVEDVDTRDEKLMSELAAKNMVQRLQSYTGDELSTTLFISGLKIVYKDKEAAYIPQMHDSTVLEYALGEQLLQLYIKDKPSEKPTIAVNIPPSPQGFNMPGRPQQGSGFEWIVDERSRMNINNKKFDVKQIDMSQNQSIPEKTALLIMIRPKLMDERQRYEVEKYLAEGGKVLLVTSPIRTFGETVEQTPFGLEAYLKDCGVAFGNAIIADRSHLSVPSQRQVYELPYFIRIKPENIDQSTSLTRLMPGLVMPTATEILLDESLLERNKLTPTVLAKTTPQTWELKANKFGAFEGDMTPKDTASINNPPKTLFAMIKGQFPFPFEGKPIPEWPVAEKDKDKEKDKNKPPPATAMVNKREGTLVICSAPEAFYAPYLEQPALEQLIKAGNVSLLMNLTESMSYGDDLIRLRTKHYETRTIAKLATADKEQLRQIWKVALIVGIPVLVMLFAIYRFILRRVGQLSYERKFSGTIGPSSFSA